MIRNRFVELLWPLCFSTFIAAGGVGAVVPYTVAEASVQKQAIDISLYQLPENGRGASSNLHLNLQGVPAGGIEIKLGTETEAGITLFLQPIHVIMVPISEPAYRPMPAEAYHVPSGYMHEVNPLSPPPKRKVFK